MSVKIGITKTDWEDKHLNYVRWIKGDGNDVEVVTLSKDDVEKIDECEGFVLSGGVDIHPEYYNGNENYDNAPSRFNTQRDDFEFSLLKKAFETQRPVLGVCRGLQLINVYCNGTLVQDMAEQNDIHTDDESDKTHPIDVERGTMLSNIVGDAIGHGKFCASPVDPETWLKSHSKQLFRGWNYRRNRMERQKWTTLYAGCAVAPGKNG